MQLSSSARYSGTFSAHWEVRQASLYQVVEEGMTDSSLPAAVSTLR
jgi:hypothetical protein